MRQLTLKWAQRAFTALVSLIGIGDDLSDDEIRVLGQAAAVLRDYITRHLDTE